MEENSRWTALTASARLAAAARRSTRDEQVKSGTVFFFIGNEIEPFL